MPTKTRKSEVVSRTKGVIVYPGASAPLLPDKPGGRTKEEAEAFSAWILKSVGQTKQPKPAGRRKSAHLRINAYSTLKQRGRIARKAGAVDA